VNQGDYTPDSICLAMGLLSFKPGAPESGWVARVLLTPSFDPELCFTVQSQGERCSVEIRVPHAQVFSTRLAPQATWTARAMLDESTALWLYQRLEEPRPTPDGRRLIVDGMGFAAILRTSNRCQQIAGHVYDPACEWIADLLKALHGATSEPGCQRGIARAGWYVGLDLSLPEPPVEPRTLRIGMLGVPAEREELAAALAATHARRDKLKD
jgi:hypothetical protein